MHDFGSKDDTNGLDANYNRYEGLNDKGELIKVDIEKSIKTVFAATEPTDDADYIQGTQEADIILTAEKARGECHPDSPLSENKTTRKSAH